MPAGLGTLIAARGPAMPEFMAAAQAGFDRHLPALAAKKKMTIAWNGEHISQRSCATDMAKLHAAYTSDDKQTLQLIYPNQAANFNQALAAFLILRGKFALLQYAVIRPCECSLTFVIHPECASSVMQFGSKCPFVVQMSALLNRVESLTHLSAASGRTNGHRCWTKTTVFP